MSFKKKDRIIVHDYNPEWSNQFMQLKNVLIKFLDLEDVQIEHVGSTSVPRLKAKPIIDLDIIIGKDETLMREVISKLRKLGYLHVGDLGITGREAFKRASTKTPEDGSRREWFAHNLYVCEKGSIGLLNHLNFRNYLRAHPELVIEYGQLKQRLAKEHPYDIDAYIDGKTNFIVEILGKTGMKESDTQLIDKENKLN